jgi:hypothetical protein
MFGYGFWDDVRVFIGLVLLAFFIPIASIGGVVVSKYLIHIVANTCEVRQ